LSDQVSEFEVRSNNEEISASLIDALLKATSKNTIIRNKSLLVAWVSTTRAVNQRELCGLFRHVADQHLARNKIDHATTTLHTTVATTTTLHHSPPRPRQPTHLLATIPHPFCVG
jgi:hypothetical protein